MRYFSFIVVVVLTLLVTILAYTLHSYWYWLLLILLPLTLLGIWDIFQTRHNLLRNYPLLAHLRWLFEGIRPEIRQYLVESDNEAIPFTREQRSLVYERAKNTVDVHPFGTDLDVYAQKYSWLNHSITPAPKLASCFCITVGGQQCSKPYTLSVFNISAMSFGALSANAIRALNKGAKMGNFAHDSGEGSISTYHREHGGDLIWEIGTGYFGCRNPDGSFNVQMFAEQASQEQVKMIEIKLSQGAKPGHGGMLPGYKVSVEIAEARHVPVGVDCLSPSGHSTFTTPIELLEFIQQLRSLSGGKPVGFKLCIGHRWEFLAIVKAMLETNIIPDFIVVDGAEGGTGAAPLEFSNHIGTPLYEGLLFVHNALYGTKLRDQIKIG
ncbi:MAG: FMN-binding glutamate synthase family protein, partial [Thiohalomonadales bacterium]